MSEEKILSNDKNIKCDNERCGNHLCRNSDCNNEAERINIEDGSIHSALCTICWKKQSEKYHIDWLGPGVIVEKSEIEKYMLEIPVECSTCESEFKTNPDKNEHRLFEKQLCKDCYRDEMGEDFNRSIE